MYPVRNLSNKSRIEIFSVAHSLCLSLFCSIHILSTSDLVLKTVEKISSHSSTAKISLLVSNESQFKYQIPTHGNLKRKLKTWYIRLLIYQSIPSVTILPGNPGANFQNLANLNHPRNFFVKSPASGLAWDGLCL